MYRAIEGNKTLFKVNLKITLTLHTFTIILLCHFVKKKKLFERSTV